MDGTMIAVEDAEQALLDGLITAIAANRSAIAALQALEITLLDAAMTVAADQTSRISRAAGRERELPVRSLAAELGAALRISDRSVQRQLSDASMLATRLPATLTSLAEGRIARAHVHVIAEAGAGIEDDAARASFERAALARAATETPGRLRPIVRTLAARADTRTVDDRHRAARTLRAVRVNDLDDGMAELIATLPAVLAHGIHDRLTRFARTAKTASPGLAVDGDADAGHMAEANGRSDATQAGIRTDAADVLDHVGAGVDGRRGASADSSPGTGGASDGGRIGADTRSFDELRADVLGDLLLAAAPSTLADSGGAVDMLGTVRATVQITVPALTLLGRSDDPVELQGYGPIDLDTARELAAASPSWVRVLTSPVDGTVLAVDRYRPSEELRRALRVRDRHCRFPGCRMSTSRCDLDHTVDHALGGSTAAANLAHLCRRHHSLKHATPWRVRQRSGGVLEWTSPTGRTYVDRPHSTVAFAAAGPPDEARAAVGARTADETREAGDVGPADETCRAGDTGPADETCRARDVSPAEEAADPTSVVPETAPPF